MELNSKPSQIVSDTKFLGLHIDKSLKWNIHIVELNTRLNKICFILRQKISKTVLKKIYVAQFEYLVKYGILLGGGTSSCSKAIFKTQKHAIRIIQRLSERKSYRSLFVKHEHTNISKPVYLVHISFYPIIIKIFW